MSEKTSMNKDNLEALGISTDDISERLIERLVNVYAGEDRFACDFEARIEKAIKDAANASIEKVITDKVLPKISEMVENITLQKCNRWGEPDIQSPKQTFKEYLTERADAYIREEVNYDGKTQAEDSYSFQKRGTRIAWMIDKHLHYHIEKIMAERLSGGVNIVRKGLEDAVKLALQNISVSVKTEVKTP
jgi:hypothetical protein